MEFKIFFSWQSDLPEKTNRGFIENALKKAAQEIRNDNSIHIEPVIDRDTLGIPGSPDIAATIFSKIDECQIFVCDCSIINQENAGRKVSNPNVLCELGYALKTLGDRKIIFIINSAYGGPEQLPFDLRTRRTVTYALSPDLDHKSIEGKKLEKKLIEEIRTIIDQMDFRKSENAADDGKFLIGRQLKYLRAELELQRSEFVELTGFESEQAYQRKEADLEECSEKEINQISDALGIFPEFLKHGHSPIFRVEIIDWARKPFEEAQRILNLSPKALFLTVTLSTSRSDLPLFQQVKNLYFGMRGSYLRVGMLVQTAWKRYEVIDLNLELNYWEDPINTKYIIEFYEFLSAICEDFVDFQILQIPSFRDTDDLYSGRLLADKAVRKYYKFYGFVHELLDYRSQNVGAKDYKVRYGKWLISLHEAFQRNLM